MAYKQALVAVDLTEEADEVMAAVRAVAGDGNMSVSVVTVIKPLTNVYGGLDMVATVGTGIVTFEQEAKKQAEKRLGALAKEYGFDDVRVLIGAPAVEIRELASTLETDLIVIGTHGKHGLGLILGSTANAVLHGVPCDVLVVKIHSVEEG
ncbi:MAG: universal stress protein [Pseudomonadales bacterium]|jgi:universal stress protein A|nr:universal stress protein [Pseudomonadales bacterium]MDP6472756.1 universal stress protein [Pseudomonadales bacterium]MDP6827969.1 universal stress protein [Pseudomonadales bacterium]MDP6972868.1 universal stress protein [Pseudomonadales bacterium]|tara:strand:+ start:305 stop:757 length:453 start_codon:yes stop_codon:yes gene_type:complete